MRALPSATPGVPQQLAPASAEAPPLGESLAELADLYDHAPCGYHMLDAQGRYLRINATGLSWLGCTREELIGRLSPADFLTAAGQQAFRVHFALLVAGQPVVGLELDLLSRDGTTRRVSVSATTVRDAEGRFVATRSVMHDITALAGAREALHRLAAEQHAMLDNDLVGIVKLRQRQAVWKNRALGRIFGYEPGRLLGQPSRMLYLDDESYHALAADAYPVLARGEIYRTQLQMRHANGDAIWIDMNGVMLSPQDDESMWMMLDITPLKRAEEQRVRAAELSAENRQLVETHRLKNLFLANMSHELRTPLNAVIGFTQLLQMASVRADPAKHDAFVRQIAAGGQHLLQLIETMLDFTAADSRRLAFHPVPVDLAIEVTNVIEMLRAKCERAGVHVDADVAPMPAPVMIDPLRLRQVLLNLVDNAVKFSHRGARVQVRVRAEEPGQFCLEVQDHGIGIAADDIARLFSHFEQLSSGLTKTHEGTGLGLALVHRMVQLQGGHVGVQSTPGVGSVFRVVLPRNPVPAAP